MVRKTLTAAVAALTLASATFTTIPSAQAGSLGKAIAIGVVGTVVGVIAGAASARSRESDERSEYRPARGEYRPVRVGYESGCGLRNSPIFDENSNRIGSRRVPDC